MQRKIQLQNQSIDYRVRSSARARCLRITIHPGGELVATLPQGVRFEKLENFLKQKANWILRKISLARKRKPSMLLPRSSRREYLAVKEQARKLAKQKIEQFSTIYGLRCQKISIRNQKTRWGSCSQKGNLNFNYRIVHLPEKYLDYIIVHEMCHLKEFNHSRNFWKLVSVAVPDYKTIRREVRNL